MMGRSAITVTIASAMLLQTGPLPARADDGPRFPTRTIEQLNPEQKVVAAEVLKQSSAGLGGPYAMLINSPELLKRYLLMTEYLRQKTSLPRRLNEMAILLEARIWDAQYEWWAHEPLARKAGLSDYIRGTAELDARVNIGELNRNRWFNYMLTSTRRVYKYTP